METSQTLRIPFAALALLVVGCGREDAFHQRYLVSRPGECQPGLC